MPDEFFPAHRTVSRLERSCRLWPNPWESPVVPRPEILREYLDGDGPLADQIARSVDCARALRLLAGGDADDPVTRFHPRSVGDDMGLSPDSLAARRRKLEESLKPHSRTRPQDISGDEFLGQVWATRGDVKHFHGSGIIGWKTWMPLPVLVVEEMRFTAIDYVCRAVACSPAALWPEDWLANDEILVVTEDGREWVAHLWLEYPVSEGQMTGRVGSLTEESKEDLLVARAARIEGLPLTWEENAGPPRTGEDKEILLERERLHDIASWLCATADARRAWREWCEWCEEERRRRRLKSSQFDQPQDPIERLPEPGAVPAGHLADQRSRAACILWPGDIAAFPGPGSQLPGSYEFTASVQCPPQADEDHPDVCLARWEIDDAEARERLREGSSFHVFRDNDFSRIIGHGLVGIIEGGAIAFLKIGKCADFREAGSLTLLFPASS